MLGFAMLAFWLLVVGLSAWVSRTRPISALWRGPLLFVCCGPPTGLIVWFLNRENDTRLARAALIMQTVGTSLALFAIGAEHAPPFNYG